MPTPLVEPDIQVSSCRLSLSPRNKACTRKPGFNISSISGRIFLRLRILFLRVGMACLSVGFDSLEVLAWLYCPASIAVRKLSEVYLAQF